MLGLVLFYGAMSGGAMTVVAPVAAVTSAVLPVITGLVAGERPGLVRLLGVGCALVAIALVSLAPSPPGPERLVTPRLLAQAALAGPRSACSSSAWIEPERTGTPGSGRSWPRSWPASPRSGCWS